MKKREMNGGDRLRQLMIKTGNTEKLPYGQNHSYSWFPKGARGGLFFEIDTNRTSFRICSRRKNRKREHGT